jgi:predicted enzyme related to lactoylglutathione lyase
MEESMAWTHGKFYWNELMTRDAERAKKFYADTLGWTYDAMPMGGGATYWLAKSGDEMVGGIFDIGAPEFAGVPESWMAYIAVDDVDARVAKAVKAGAKVMKPAFDVPGVGRIVILMEPGGAGVGWMTPSN